MTPLFSQGLHDDVRLEYATYESEENSYMV